MKYYYVKNLDNGKPICNVFVYTDCFADARRRLVDLMLDDPLFYENVCHVYERHVGPRWNFWDIIVGIDLA